MKRFCSVAMMCMLCFIMTWPAAADNVEADVYVAGKAETLDGGFIFENGEPEAALGELAGLLGAQCGVDSQTKTVTVRYGDHTLRIQPDASGIEADGEYAEASAPVRLSDGKLYVPVQDICLALGAGCFYDEETETAYIEPGFEDMTVPQGINVPVMMYHAVGDDVWGYEELFVKTDELRAQLKYVTENGYTPITFEDMGRLDEIEKPVMFVFDDGYRNNYTELFPLLVEYNVKATTCPITNAIGNDLYLTEDMIKEMARSGLVSFQNHTHTHAELINISDDEINKEIETSQLILTRLTGRRPVAICYPFGYNNEHVRELLSKEFKFGVKISGRMFSTSDDLMQISRYYVSRNTTIDQFSAMLAGG